jgi:membrane protease YdiL (CAAX protease family)
MNEAYFLSSDHLDAGVAVLSATIGFILFWMVVSSPTLIPYLAKNRSQVDAQETKIHLQRLVGVTVFGVIPAILFIGVLGRSWASFGVVSRFSMEDLWWTLGLSALAIPIAYSGARKEEGKRFYPEIRRPEWGARTLFLSAIGWVSYTIAYELLFRGFLVFSCYRVMGIGPAIAVNIAIYALAHVPKRMTEGIGSLVFGVILCFITLQSGCVWVAVLVHIVLALSNEWFSLKLHPNIRYAG